MDCAPVAAAMSPAPRVGAAVVLQSPGGLHLGEAHQGEGALAELLCLRGDLCRLGRLRVRLRPAADPEVQLCEHRQRERQEGAGARSSRRLDRALQHAAGLREVLDPEGAMADGVNQRRGGERVCLMPAPPQTSQRRRGGPGLPAQDERVAQEGFGHISQRLAGAGGDRLRSSRGGQRRPAVARHRAEDRGVGEHHGGLGGVELHDALRLPHQVLLRPHRSGTPHLERPPRVVDLRAQERVGG